MESLSRPFHRRKLSNANSFSSKNPYDGVFSGHRPKFDRVPVVNVDEYREIFSGGQAASSIPVLDLSTLQESSDGSNLELGSTKPDYGMIFGGFRDEDIAVSYEELVARDKARPPLSTSQSSEDLDGESLDALKQFNMSYNKISQRNKDGLDVTTHVTQLHAVPGFTFFIDESASQPKKETKNKKPSIPNNVHSPVKETSQNHVESKSYHQDDRKVNIKSHNSKVSSSPTPSPMNTEESSKLKMETEKTKPIETENVHPIKSSKKDSHETKNSQSAVECKSKDHQDESLSGYTKIDLKSDNSKVPAANGEPTFESKKETDKKKSSETDDDVLKKQTSKKAVEPKPRSIYHQDEYFSGDKKIDLKSHDSKVPAANCEPTSESKKETDTKKPSETDDDVLKKQTSEKVIEHKSRSISHQDESLSNDRISKKAEADINLHSFNASSSSSLPATSATNVDNDKDFEKRSSTWTWKSDKPGAFSSTCFDEELDVNSAAGASAAALKKAIEKAQESIRIAKESVGRKKEGLKTFSTKTFKDSLKVKARMEHVSTIVEEEEKEKSNWIKEFFKARVASVNTSQVVGRNHEHGDTVVFSKDINGKILESKKSSEMPLGSCNELKDDKIVYDSKEETKGVEYATSSSEEVENNTNESMQKDNERPSGFLVIESYENKDEVGPSDGYKLVEKTKETNNLTLYEKVEDEKKVSHDCDENVYEKSLKESLGLLENIKQDVVEQEHNEEVASEESHELNSDDEVFEEKRQVKEDDSETEEEEEEEEEEKGDKFYDVCEVETTENSSSDYDDAEDIEIIHFPNRFDIDTHEVDDISKVNQSDNIMEPSQELDDISKVDQTENNAEPSQEIDDVTKVDQNMESSEEVDDVSNNSSPKVTLEDTEEKEMFTASLHNEDKHEQKSDDELSCCGIADVEEAEENNEQCESCTSDTIHGMEIEVKEYKKSEETIIKEMETEAKEHEKKMEESRNTEREKQKEREREREREKLAVERVIREARERSFNEVREKVAVERASAQVRQRVMDAKANSKASDSTSKMRAERAAVERATSEARQRALEKAMSQKKVQTSSDLDVSNGTNAESALRSKAKLEKHNRIMERAAKALAEKEKRDQLAQKEQAERNRLAENLDADIKRWSTGKEGNLRALLSTLQYILGPESGWQSVSLTEIITTSAVKKAYRKATLCVHPDKLQQRGASIQQKYICEKVFDLLKAAWNKFNSEER
ncbi:hypothetical protein LXL04_008881 [Taraxacum kok-saghyz]